MKKNKTQSLPETCRYNNLLSYFRLLPIKWEGKLILFTNDLSFASDLTF